MLFYMLSILLQYICQAILRCYCYQNKIEKILLCSFVELYYMKQNIKIQQEDGHMKLTELRSD